MSLKCFSITSTSSFSPPPLSLLNLQRRLNMGPRKPHLAFPSLSSSTVTCRLAVSFDDIAAIAQNKVLIAAGVSAAIGQFSKPFTSVLLYGKSFDFRAVIQAGGFPSTHSSAVVATATSLALERGFSDSIFGLSAVYAALIMYDAQGVRREVGIHARTVNRLLLDDQTKTRDDSERESNTESVQEESSSSSKSSSKSSSSSLFDETSALRNKQTDSPLLLESRIEKSLTERRFTRSRRPSDTVESSERVSSFLPLKESIGHTEVEVIAGALLGFLVSLTVNAII